jgi:hypothetical protein
MQTMQTHSRQDVCRMLSFCLAEQTIACNMPHVTSKTKYRTHATRRKALASEQAAAAHDGSKAANLDRGGSQPG